MEEHIQRYTINYYGRMFFFYILAIQILNGQFVNGYFLLRVTNIGF